MRNVSCWQTVTAKFKKTETADNLLHLEKKYKMKSQRTKQHIYKPHQPTQNQSLQKSCFLAFAPCFSTGLLYF
jgi:hypothetical protein